MKRSIVLLSAATLVAASFPAQAQSEKAWENANHHASFRCGTRHPTATEMEAIEKQFRDLRARLNAKKPDNPGGGKPGGGGDGGDGGGGPQPPGAGSIVIDVWFHVVHDGNNGKLSAGEIGASIDVLNEAYSGLDSEGPGYDTPYRFFLARGWAWS